MKHKVSIIVAMCLYLAACAQSEFSAGSSRGQGLNAKKCNPAADPSCKKPVPGGPNDELPGDLKTDTGESVEIVDASLTVTRNGDGAHFQNCMEAYIDGQQPVSLGCNRPAPHPASYGSDNPVSAVTIKLKTGVCNVLKLRMTTKISAFGSFSPTLTTSSRVYSAQTKPTHGPGFLINKISDRFEIGANDNSDNNWVDLSLSIKGDGRAKFTIEGTNISCD